MKKYSLRVRIPIFISVLALVSVLLTGWVLQTAFKYKLEESIEDKNFMISEMASNGLELYLKNATETAITAANFSTQSNGDLNEIKKEIFRMYDNFDYFDLIFFMNSDAKMVFSKPGNEKIQSRTYTDRDYYWAIMEDEKESFLSELLVSSVLKKLHFIIAAPVKNENQTIIGLIGAGIPLKDIEIVLEDFEEGFDGKIWIADQNGNIAIHPKMSVSGESFKIDELGIEALEGFESIEDIRQSKNKMNTRYLIDGDEYYAAVTHVENADWIVVVEQNAKTVSREIKATMSNLVIVQIFVLIVALLMGLIIAQSVTRPVHKLMKLVGVLPGNLKNNETIDVLPLDNESDEIIELSHAFIVMANQIQGNLHSIEKAYRSENRIQQYLNNILASVHSGIVVADSNNRVNIINKQGRFITGIEDEFDFNIDLFELLRILEIDIKAEVEYVIHNQSYCSETESKMKPFKKGRIAISYTCSAVKDEDSNYLGVVLQFRDITRMKAIETSIRKEDRISILGEVSASIIHDIGNPLAGMANLIEVITDDTILNESKNEAFSLLSEEVNDLNLLVINFLDFVKNGDVQKKPTNLVKLVEDCLALFKTDRTANTLQLNRNFGNQEAIVNITSRSVKQAIINIYKNATEAVENKGIIDINIIETNRTYELVIKDDGKGMTDEERVRLFDPFFSTKSDGIGLGLRIAYSALKENNVKLLVESELGVGSIFTLIFEKGE